MTTTTTANASRETAAGHVERDVPVFRPDVTADEALRMLGGRRYASIGDLAICDGSGLIGLVTIEDLLAAERHRVLADLMDPDPPTVGPGADQEVAAWEMIHRGESSLAVVDDAGTFVGLVPPARMLGVLLREHEEDLRRLGGFLHDTARARLSSREPIRQRLVHRVPWLVVGLLGAMASAVLLRGFEPRLSDRVELAFFIPGIVYLAGAVGTQTETLVVRGLSVGVSVGSTVRSELVTGALIALLLATAVFPFAVGLSGAAAVASVVSLAVLASCATATLIGIALPRGLTAIGQDPAFGSGPLVSIVQDLFSITVYVLLAIALL